MTGTPEAPEQVGGLTEAQPEPVVEELGEGPRVRAESGTRRPEGVGGLLGVTSLHPAPAVLAPPDADVEAGDDRT